MYGFSGYATNSYASKRQEPAKPLLAIIATRTVILFTNFARTVVAMTNQTRKIPI